MRAHFAKLVNERKAAQNRVIVNINVASKRAIVGHDSVIANGAIMRDMHVSHNPVIVADFGHAFILNGATIKGAEFANGIIVANFKCGRLACILFILRRFTK